MKKMSIMPLTILVLMVSTGLLLINIDDKYLGESSAPIKSIENVNLLDEQIVGGVTSIDLTSAQLKYLIEEEKLAHDVYTKMFDLYGARVFGNILNSESTHQLRVLSLLNTRGIPDPRSEYVGIFDNPDLQALYDQLITQGNISETEAFKVGVTIEEKDIADISYQLSTASDTDIISTLEDLRRGSENHLRAFSKQI